jgi:hypothetical protein
MKLIQQFSHRLLEITELDLRPKSTEACAKCLVESRLVERVETVPSTDSQPRGQVVLDRLVSVHCAPFAFGSTNIGVDRNKFGDLGSNYLHDVFGGIKAAP